MIGQQIGSYRLLKVLGEGGMGRVFLAEHVLMGDLWAVKILADEFTHKVEIVARFVDEARAAARVRHRNLVRVFHADRTLEGLCYMVLEYLEGAPLSRLIAEGPASIEIVIRIGCQVASALREIHKHGIVHRDIKPENIVLVVRDHDIYVPIVLDLGVAHLGRDLATGPGTQTGLVIGTPSYMSPEQLLGEAVDAAADLFSLGVMLYELATGGHLPWQHSGETREQYYRIAPAKLFRRQQDEQPVDPRRHVPTMTDAVAMALLAPLAFQPAARSKDERAYIVALAQAAPGDELTPDGLEIVKELAPGLLESDHARATHRVAAPAIISTPGSEAKYILGEKLGTGGMAEVFVGETIGVAGFSRLVAIKRVRPELSAQEAFEAMFISEARIASRLLHPNIVAVSDFRKDDQGRLFLVMEYVDGKDLAALAEAGPLSIPVIIYIMMEMLRGLGYAHSRVDPVSHSSGVIHRDVSPHNVIVSREGEVKIGDFGLSRAMDPLGRAISSTVRGKVSYMAPEQAKGETLDQRTDLFAAGIVFYELLTRGPLFVGSISETIGSLLHKDIQRPSELNPSVPAELDAIALKMLERDPKARYQAAEAAIRDLRNSESARIDGRDELIGVMRDRFPRPGEKRSTVAMRIASGARSKMTAPEQPSTLGSAASQSAPHVAPPPRASRAPIYIGVVMALILAISPTMIIRARHRGHAVTTDAATLVVSPDVRDPAVAGAPVVDAAMIHDASVSVAVTVDAGTIDAAASRDAGTDHHEIAHVGAGSAAPIHHTTTAPPFVTNPATPGELAIKVKPWAKIWLNGKFIHETPFREPLPSGRYRLRLVNEVASKDESLTITIEPDKTTTIERDWK